MSETPAQFKERLGIGKPSNAFRRVGGPGTTRTTPVQRDEGPGVAGTRTVHWDGRTDAACTRPTITATPALRARIAKLKDTTS